MKAMLSCRISIGRAEPCPYGTMIIFEEKFKGFRLGIDKKMINFEG